MGTSALDSKWTDYGSVTWVYLPLMFSVVMVAGTAMSAGDRLRCGWLNVTWVLMLLNTTVRVQMLYTTLHER